MYVLPLPLLLARGLAGALTTVGIISKKASEDAASTWAMEAMKTYRGGFVCFTYMCVPK